MHNIRGKFVFVKDFLSKPNKSLLNYKCFRRLLFFYFAEIFALLILSEKLFLHPKYFQNFAV